MSLTPISLEIDQGDDEQINITVKDADGAIVDLTGCALSFAVGTSPAVAPILAKDSGVGNGIEILDQSGADKGKAEITISKEDTEVLEVKYLGRTLKWELDAVDSLDNEITLARGTIVINRDMVVA